MRLVVIESPFAGKNRGHWPESDWERERNVNYARAAMHDCLRRGEAPIASHLLYTQPGVLNDNKPEERKLGIEAGLLWGAQAEATVVYADLGISAGMQQGIERAEADGRLIETRTLLDPGPGQDWCCDCWTCLREKTVSYGAGDGSQTGRGGFFRCKHCNERYRILTAADRANEPHEYEEASNSPAAGALMHVLDEWPCRLCGKGRGEH